MILDGMGGANPHIYLPLIVFLFSIIQSLLGVGLLLFGTPTLMLLGMNFGDTLAVLLPCSVAINLCQLLKGLPQNRVVLFRMVSVTLPMVFVGLLIALGGLKTDWMPVLVGTTLLGLGALRVSPGAMTRLHQLVTRHQRLYMAVMGLVHGLSNMGGGLLVAFAGSVTEDKDDIRKTVALGYLLFALTQLVTLAIFHPGYLHAEHFYLPVISVLTYLVGNLLFRHLSTIQFSRLVTGLIVIYGVITVGKVLI